MLSRGLVFVTGVLVLVALFGACTVDASDCGNQPCRNDGNCTDPNANNGTGQCSCPVGWTGHHCKDDNTACLPADVCNYNGTCLPLTHTTFQCDCFDGYYGPRCDWTEPVSQELPGLTAFLLLLAMFVCLFIVGMLWYRQQRRMGITSPIRNKINEWRDKLQGKAPQTYSFNNPNRRTNAVQMESVVDSE